MANALRGCASSPNSSWRAVRDVRIFRHFVHDRKKDISRRLPETRRRRPKPGKARLDVLIVERGLAPSRERAQALLLAGQIRVNGAPAEKPGTQVATDVQIELSGETLRYASRGGLKLEGALEDFGVTPENQSMPRRGKLDWRLHRLPSATRRAKGVCRGRNH